MRRQFSEIERVPNTGHFNEFVEECTIGCVLPNLETEENDVLMERVALFRELR